MESEVTEYFRRFFYSFDIDCFKKQQHNIMLFNLHNKTVVKLRQAAG